MNKINKQNKQNKDYKNILSQNEINNIADEIVNKIKLLNSNNTHFVKQKNLQTSNLITNVNDINDVNETPINLLDNKTNVYEYNYQDMYVDKNPNLSLDQLNRWINLFINHGLDFDLFEFYNDTTKQYKYTLNDILQIYLDKNNEFNLSDKTFQINKDNEIFKYLKSKK